MGEDTLYEIDDILDVRSGKDRIEYFVKWKGYPSSQNTWEPETNFDAKWLKRHLKKNPDLVLSADDDVQISEKVTKEDPPKSEAVLIHDQKWDKHYKEPVFFVQWSTGEKSWVTKKTLANDELIKTFTEAMIGNGFRAPKQIPAEKNPQRSAKRKEAQKIKSPVKRKTKKAHANEVTWTEDDQFEVENILDHKIRNNRTYYLIKWKDWASSYNSWEPDYNVSSYVIDVYHAVRQGKRPPPLPKDTSEDEDDSANEHQIVVSRPSRSRTANKGRVSRPTPGNLNGSLARKTSTRVSSRSPPKRESSRSRSPKKGRPSTSTSGALQTRSRSPLLTSASRQSTEHDSSRSSIARSFQKLLGSITMRTGERSPPKV